LAEITAATLLDVDKIRALGNRDRLRILELLVKHKSMSWTELQEALRMNPNTLNFHLAKLLHSELVARSIYENREKPRHVSHYSLTEAGLTYYQRFATMSKR